MKRPLVIAIIFSILNALPALATPSISIITSSNGNSAAGTNVTITASVITTNNAPVAQVAFYDNPSSLLVAQTTPSNNTCTGSGTGACTETFTYTWDTTGLTGSYNISAAVLSEGVGTLNSNVVIDVVGNPNLTPPPFPQGSANPVTDSTIGTIFGGPSVAISPAIPATTWLEGDNQMCTTTWPYNGYSLAFPDGSCEWMGKAAGGGTCATGTCSSSGTCSNGSACSPVAPTTGDTETIDNLDDAMHTLSDFTKFSNSLLALDSGALVSTFKNWYPQVAAWIAPACGTTAGSSECLNNSVGTTLTCALCTSDMFDQQLCPETSFCNRGSNGRLLSIYDPNITNATDPVTRATGPWDEFKYWNEAVSSWLVNQYTTPSSGTVKPWCVGPEATLLNGNASTTEDTYIKNNSVQTTCPGATACPLTGPSAGKCSDGSACVPWGDLSHVMACLNYNGAPYSAGVGNSAAYAYQQCLDYLSQAACPTVSTLTGTPCDPSILGRSLDTQTPIPWNGGEANCSADPTCVNRCNTTYTNTSSPPKPSMAKWVSDSYTLFTNEAPKFALRSLFLRDIYNRATTLQKITGQADTALHNFFKPCGGCADGGGVCSGGTGTTAGTCSIDNSACGGPKCVDGGAVAQLFYASTQPAPTHALPNAVIYGWVDNTYPNGHKGYAHIVKVAAFSPGRGGSAQIAGDGGSGFIQPLLPWINTWTTTFLKKYALAARDGYVYVSVKRWDEDHDPAHPVTFPNNHTLWQFLFHYPLPTNGTSTGSGLIGACNGLSVGPTSVGYGLLPATVTGLSYAMAHSPTGSTISSTQAADLTALSNAFMLNDEGDGTIDPSAGGSGMAAGETCAGGAGSGSGSTTYCPCLKQANDLLASGVESHACARYLASSNASESFSGNGDSYYSLKYVDCNSVPYFNPQPPDDLTYN